MSKLLFPGERSAAPLTFEKQVRLSELSEVMSISPSQIIEEYGYWGVEGGTFQYIWEGPGDPSTIQRQTLPTVVGLIRHIEDKLLTQYVLVSVEFAHKALQKWRNKQKQKSA